MLLKERKLRSSDISRVPSLSFCLSNSLLNSPDLTYVIVELTSNGIHLKVQELSLSNFTDHGMSFITADADDYFAEIAGTGFDVLYEELNVKKEIVEIDAALAGKLGKATYEAFMKTGSKSRILFRNKAP